MNQGKTDIRILKKGIVRLIISLPFLVLGPILITLSRLNKETFVFYIFFVFGVTAAITAVYFAFSGINTIIKSIFGEPKNSR